MRSLWRLRWFFYKYRYRYLIAIAMLLGVLVFNMLPPILTGRVIDSIQTGVSTPDFIYTSIAQLIGVGFTVYLLRYGWRQMLFGTSLRLGAEIRAKLYRTLSLHTPSFYQRYGTGDLMARATNDITAVEMMAGETVLAMVDGVLTGTLVVVIILVLFPWEMAVAALAPWPFLGLTFLFIGRRLHRYFSAAQIRFSKLNHFVQQRLSNLSLVRGYGILDISVRQFNKEAAAASNANLNVARADSFYDPVIALTIACSFLFSLAIAAPMIVSGELTMGQLTAFNLYLSYLIWPMYALGWMLNLLERGSAALDRIDQIIDEETDFHERSDVLPFEFHSISWSIQNFKYPSSSKPVLRGIQGHADQGEIVGIAGKTGVGKSTLLELITRQYIIDEGYVSLNDKPLDQLSANQLAQYQAVVQQKPFIFSMSIAENIALQRPTATLDEIVNVAKIASIHEDIELMDAGYATQVGEKGVTLSGGQRQRIAIARALLAETPLLIFDDALSAVDVATERRILSALRKNLGKRSLIVVSHRLTAFHYADRVYVLESGRLVGVGTHHELSTSKDTWYQTVYDLQNITELGKEI